MGNKQEKTAQTQQETPQQEASQQEVSKQETPEQEVSKQEEKTGAVTKTTAMAAAQKIAKSIFKGNPAMKEVHVTSDGTAFYTLNDAKNHARTLSNKGVITLKRKDVQ